MSLIDAAFVRSILDYDPDAGVFAWRKRPREHFKTKRACSMWNTRYSGHHPGSIDHGYVRINIDQFGKFYAHRLAWIWMTGAWPTHGVDHRDLDRLNNRWCNLREATQSQNCANSRIRSHNTSGHKGVTWDVSKRKWAAQITKNGKNIHLGRFDADKLDEAARAYERAAGRIHGKFARLA